jgi:hypothetical protein
LKGLPATADCASGSASITVNVPRNTTSAAHTYLLYLTAADPGATSTTIRAMVVERARTSTAAPVITVQPMSQSVFSATPVTLTAAASGNPRPRVQWQVSTNNGASWDKVAGATSISWSFTPTPVATGYQYREYRAVFTNSFGSATTAAGTLMISAATAPGVTKGATGTSTVPVITTQPTSQSVTYNAWVTFTAAASGNPTPTKQWQVSTNGGSTWANTNFSFVASTSDNGYEYRAVFTNTAGSATTNTATLTVAPETSPNWVPVITTQPTSQSVTYDAVVMLIAAASGNPTPTAQWQVSTNGGSTWANTSVPFVAITSDNGNEYRAVFTNAAGSATTNTATLTVAPTSNSAWSGYVATGESFSAVAGSWTVPTLTCPAGSNTDSAEWVGIDGWGGATVEQDGVDSDCRNGSPHYFAWYEIYGDPDLAGGLPIVVSEPVAAGDVITASVSLSGSTWLFGLADATKGWTTSIPVPSPTPSPAQASAEWIVEDPGGCTPECLTLADFSPVSFTGATATGNGRTGRISSFPYTAAQIVDIAVQIPPPWTVFAAPGPVDSAGDGFTDTWYAN